MSNVEAGDLIVGVRDAVAECEGPGERGEVGARAVAGRPVQHTRVRLQQAGDPAEINTRESPRARGGRTAAVQAVEDVALRQAPGRNIEMHCAGGSELPDAHDPAAEMARSARRSCPGSRDGAAGIDRNRHFPGPAIARCCAGLLSPRCAAYRPTHRPQRSCCERESWGCSAHRRRPSPTEPRERRWRRTRCCVAAAARPGRGVGGARER